MKRKIRGIGANRLDDYKKWKDGVFKQIRKILQTDWDPIGVYQDRPLKKGEYRSKDFYWPDGEYEDYEQMLFLMMSAKFSPGQIAKLLNFLADEWMGCGQPFAKNLRVAKALLKIHIRKQWN